MAKLRVVKGKAGKEKQTAEPVDRRPAFDRLMDKRLAVRPLKRIPEVLQYQGPRRRDEVMALYAISFLLDWTSDIGDRAVPGMVANGISHMLQFIAARQGEELDAALAQRLKEDAEAAAAAAAAEKQRA